MSELQLPKEFWFGISDGNKPHVNTKQVWPTDYHVIEYSAYEELKRKLEIAKRALEEIINHSFLESERSFGHANKALKEIGE